MIFTPTPIAGAYIIDIEKNEDERGFFARTWCQQEFENHGLHASFVQCNVSHNNKIGTLRGMHYQTMPHEETKMVSCISGAIYDVILDVRDGSQSFGVWYSVELTADNYRSLYVPNGVAHGFQTLKENSTVFYQISEFYHPEYGRGVKWDDPFFSIQWAIDNPTISQRDGKFPLWTGDVKC